MKNIIKSCPSGENIEHNPQLCCWDDIVGKLTIRKAVVRCYCGFTGPERYGDNAEEEAIKAWNVRSLEIFYQLEYILNLIASPKTKKIPSDSRMIDEIIRIANQALSKMER